MTWKLFGQQQQRGAQLHARPGQETSSGAPKEAVEDRAAQDHEAAGQQKRPAAGYPASREQDRDGDDNTPTAPEPAVQWDEVVQSEHHPQVAEEFDDDMPLPEGK